jgi:hypothetical protein
VAGTGGYPEAMVLLAADLTIEQEDAHNLADGGSPHLVLAL